MRLIVIEGVDGAGKSTQIKLIKNFFEKQGHNCEYLHFPRTESPFYGELIARFLRGEFGSLNNVDPYLVAMLYAGDRKDASDTIYNWLNDGKFVLLDRYTYSNIAYQCAKLKDIHAQDKLMKWIFSLEFNYLAIPQPDLNIFLDVPLSFTAEKLSDTRMGNDRAYLNGNRDIHEESLVFQKNVRDIYLRVSKTDKRLEVVNCSSNNETILSPEEIFDRIKNIIINKKLL